MRLRQMALRRSLITGVSIYRGAGQGLLLVLQKYYKSISKVLQKYLQRGRAGPLISTSCCRCGIGEEARRSRAKLGGGEETGLLIFIAISLQGP